MKTPAFVWGVPVVFVVMGLLWTLFIAGRAGNGMASPSWPSTSGMVLQCDRHVSTTESRTHVRSVLRYEYVVDGSRYEGTTYSFAGYRPLDCEALPAGQAVRVYHSPVRPEVAALVPGVDDWVWVQLGTGGLCLLLGLGVGGLQLWMVFMGPAARQRRLLAGIERRRQARADSTSSDKPPT